jgi:hypothetical protein
MMSSERRRDALEEFLPSVERVSRLALDPVSRIDALMEPFDRLLRSGFLPEEFTSAEPGDFFNTLCSDQTTGRIR